MFLLRQFMNEKIGGAKGTELDDEFILMEKVCISPFMPHLKCCVCFTLSASGGRTSLSFQTPKILVLLEILGFIISCNLTCLFVTFSYKFIFSAQNHTKFLPVINSTQVY